MPRSRARRSSASNRAVNLRFARWSAFMAWTPASRVRLTTANSRSPSSSSSAAGSAASIASRTSSSSSATFSKAPRASAQSKPTELTRSWMRWARERVEPAGEAVQHGAVAALAGLQGLPRLGFAAVEVGVPAPHLGLQPGGDGLGVERAALFGEHDLEGEVEEEVAEFAGQGVVVLFGDGVRDLVGLFEQVGEQGRRCLRGVPGAVGAQEPDEVERAVEARPAGGGMRRKIGHLGLRRNP